MQKPIAAGQEFRSQNRALLGVSQLYHSFICTKELWNERMTIQCVNLCESKWWWNGPIRRAIDTSWYGSYEHRDWGWWEPPPPPPPPPPPHHPTSKSSRTGKVHRACLSRGTSNRSALAGWGTFFSCKMHVQKTVQFTTFLGPGSLCRL